MRTLKIIAFILTIIGAINWGLVGVLKVDLVAILFGNMSFLTRLVYSLVGVSGIFSLFALYNFITDEI